VNPRLGRTFIALTEESPTRLAREALPEAVGAWLWRHYSPQVAVEFPSPKTNGQWQLTGQGWIGYLPVTPALTVVLQPKTPVSNVFRMLEYAHRLKGFRVLDGLIGCTSLEEFYTQLAYLFARRVLDWSRKGLYRTYVTQRERLPYVRGRLEVAQVMRATWMLALTSHYDEQTVDVEDNQILAWTLSRIACSGLCTPHVQPTIHRAHRKLQECITLRPVRPDVCVGRVYNRLNADYQPLHALCHFFLEHMGPSHEMGNHRMLPFLVDMAQLYERFVAEWLRVELPPEVDLKAQERLHLDAGKRVHFIIDLVLYDVKTGEARCVIDTKYKIAPTPTTVDVAQVVAYAEAKRCRDAVLVYPQSLTTPLDGRVGDIRVRTLAFPLGGDLNQAGQALIHALL
jgi:5-methylcytosine-specific restriction enzyme subunit McrC